MTMAVFEFEALNQAVDDKNNLLAVVWNENGERVHGASVGISRYAAPTTVARKLRELADRIELERYHV